MDQQIKTDWLKALRSGRYKQAEGQLVNNKGAYCCLGVLARVQGAKKKELLNKSFLENKVFYETEGELVSKLAKYAAGLRRSSQGNLADLNDDGKSFKEIADYIEKRYK